MDKKLHFLAGIIKFNKEENIFFLIRASLDSYFKFKMQDTL